MKRGLAANTDAGKDHLSAALEHIRARVLEKDAAATVSAVVPGPRRQQPWEMDTGGMEGAQAPGPKFLLQFTCDHGECARPLADRTTQKIISQVAYKQGIVLVRCGCDKLHLIADNLGWFGDKTDIERILAERGETVVRDLERSGSAHVEWGPGGAGE